MSILTIVIGIGGLDRVGDLSDAFYSLSTHSLVALTHALVCANGQLPWLREWINAQIEARDESRRHSRDLDSTRRGLRREINELSLQIGALHVRIEHPKEDQHVLGKELKALEGKLRKLQTQEESTARQIKACESSLCDRLWTEPLGIDRWARKYWWVAKRLFVEIDEHRGHFWVSEGDSQPAESAVAIEGTTGDDGTSSVHEAVASSRREPRASEQDAAMAVDVEMQEPEEEAVESASQWYYYCDRSHLDDLLAYLSPYGRSEAELLVALEELRSTLPATQSTAGNASEQEAANHTDTSEVVDMFSDERSDGGHESAGRRMHVRRSNRGMASAPSDKHPQLYVNKMR